MSCADESPSPLTFVLIRGEHPAYRQLVNWTTARASATVRIAETFFIPPAAAVESRFKFCDRKFRLHALPPSAGHDVSLALPAHVSCQESLPAGDAFHRFTFPGGFADAPDD